MLLRMNHQIYSKGNNKPVVNISWNDAIVFCNLLSKKAGLKEYYSISDGGQIG